MTKAQKKMFKALKRDDHRLGFVGMLTHQQASLGRYGHWAPAYKRKCLKKGATQPLKTIPKTG